MAAEVTLNVKLDDARAKAGLKAIADSIKPLSTPVKIDIDTKNALKSLRDLNTVASNLEKQLNKGREGLGNGHDEWLRKQANDAKAFSNALKQQMQAEQDAAQSRRGLVSEMNAWDQAIHANEASGKAFSAALKQQMQAEQDAAREAKKAGQAAKESGSDAAQGANGWSVLGGAISTAIGHLASRAVTWAFQKVNQAFREALTTMKDVDKELANIQKVTGESNDVIARLGDTAYDTASKYGIAANDFLSASADFAKAGYDNYDAMAELATKTQLVGDVSADVASKFLLSADAAFKFGGDIGQLSTVLDKANVIENNYATSIEKLADGFPIVANTAAMANMSIDETMAAIGTITAVTQESGPMAARALRALILNILKDTTTEVEDGVTVTKDQIKSLQDALKKYAPDVVKAAEATGKIIDPMEAIGALSKAWEEGLLSEQELAAMVTDIGGKLRTNQLLALIKNFDMFNEMLDKSKESAGSADKEIEIMLGTWEAKTNQLKNSWTELVSDLVDTGAIKGGVDMLRGLVDGLDEVIEKWKNPFWSESENKNGSFENVKAEYDSLLSRAGELNSLELLRLDYLRQQLGLMKDAADEAAKQAAERRNEVLLSDAWAYYDENGNKLSHRKSVDGDLAELSNLRGKYGELEGFLASGDVAGYQEALRGLVSESQNYYDELIKIRDAGIDLTGYQEQFISDFEGMKTAADSNIESAQNLGAEYIAFYDAAGNMVAVVERAQQATEETANAQEQSAKSWADYFVAYDTAMANSLGGAQGLTTEEENIASGADSAAEAASGIDFSSATSSAQTLLGVIQAIDAAANGISIGFGGFGFATGTANAPGGPTLVNELGPELISENGRAYIANGGKPGIVNLSKGAVVLPANVTKDALRGGGGKTLSIKAAKGGLAGLTGRELELATTTRKVQESLSKVPGGSKVNAVAIAKQILRDQVNGGDDPSSTSGAKQPKQTSTVSNEKTEGGEKGKGKGKGGGGSGSSGGGGVTAKSVEDLAKETKDILSNIEKQAKLADNRGQYDKEASLYGQGQKQIDKMVAAYKKAGYKETDDEVLDLLNKRYDYEKKKDAASKKTIEEAAKELKDKLSNLEKQADVAEKQEDYLSQVKFYEQAQEAIKAMVERYRKAGYKDDSDEILGLLKKNYDYADKQVSIYKDRWNELIDALETDTEQQELANALEEKQQALEDARLSLENAQKQRTIRMYNASTGQWEWVRDEAKVKSAQESLTKAEKDYADEVKDQAVKEIEKMRDTLADLNDVVLGPALTSVMAMAESSNEFQNFARALNAVYGVGSYLGSTEGSSRVISTANDSHDTIYTFGNVTLTEEQASTMSVAQLAQKLQVLKIS